MTELQAGQIIGGYRIEETIAQGGMGVVYRGKHVDLHRTVAIKVLKKELSEYPDVIQRFLREGQVIARLDHRGIIEIFDLGKEGDHYYLVMEFVEGQDLEKIVKQSGPLPPARALGLARLVAEALDYAHNLGIVHRDIKPSNIMLAGDESVRITDFGIARLLEQETQITNPGSLIGTPICMSPEQCRGGAIDGRSDLYSLGATLYILLSGKPPFSGKNAATLINQILHQNPPPLESTVKNLNPDVVTLVKRLMAKHPAARFQTGKELCAGIDEISRKRLTFSRDSDSSRPSAQLDEETSSVVKPLLGAFLLIALVIGCFTLWVRNRETEASAERGVNVPAVTPRDPPKRAPGEKGARFIPKSTRDPAEPPQERAVDPAERRRELEERLDRFIAALRYGDSTEPLNFIDPRIRNQPGLIPSLGRILERVKRLGPSGSIEKSYSMDNEKADVYLIFRKAGKAGASAHLKLPITWRFRDGTWYLQPRADLQRPGEQPKMLRRRRWRGRGEEPRK